MAESKGITIQFRGDTTDFEKSVKKINGELKQTRSDIGLLNKELKFDPKNVEALGKKFDALRQKEQKLTELTEVLQDAMSKFDPNTKEWDSYNRQLQKAQVELQGVRQELSQTPSANLKVIGDGFEEWGNKLNKVGDKLQDIGKKLSVVSAGIMGLVAGGIKYNAQLEQYQVAFTTLIGNAEEASDAISKIQEDASKSPFSTDALIEANQYLISAGVSADDARSTINALGDAISATGGGSNELSRMAQNLQQIKNLGKASSVDIKQFANAGINIYGLLADSMGLTVDEIKEMDISFDVLNDALQKASSEGGQYFGAMETQSQTINGSISTLKDNIQQLLGELTAELVPVIKEILEYLLELVRKLKAMSPEQKAQITNIALMVASLGPALTMLGNIISTIGTLSTAIGGLLKSQALTSFFSGATSAGGVLSGVIAKLGSVFKALTGPIGIVLSLFGLFYATSDEVRESTNGVAGALGGVLLSAFNLIKNVIGAVIDVIKWLLGLLGDLWKKFLESSVGQVFVDVLTTIMDVIKTLIGWVEKLIGWLDKAVTWFRDLIGASDDFNSATIKSQGKMTNAGFDVMSGGYMNSGGMMSNEITVYNTFTINNGDGINQDTVNSWADAMTRRINLNLGRMV